MAKHRKKKKIKKGMLALFILLAVLVLFFIVLFIFDRKENSDSNKLSDSEITNNDKNGDSNSSNEKGDKVQFDEPELSKEEQKVNELLSEMSLEEEVYQLFIVTPEQLTKMGTVTVAGEKTKSAISKYPVGGIIYFSQNIVSPDQTKEMLSNTNNYFSEIEGVSPFLCVDEEGGTVSRIAKNPSFGVKNVGNMSDVKTSDEAYQAGKYIGAYLSDLGFNVDFAPDADVLTNESSIVSKRSFGQDPDTVSDFSMNFSNGLHEEEVLSTYKHFPGHGAVGTDTHSSLATITKSLDEMMDNELLPFSRAKDDNIDFVMVTHIACPNITGDNTPSSLSSTMITDVLKDKLGYDGIIITDSFQMGAVTDTYSSSEAAVMAISAGADIVLMPDDMNAAAEGVLSAVNDGTISKERLDESVRKILLRKVLMEEGK